MARLFIAVPLPENTSEQLAGAAAAILPRELFRLVPPVNLHITLAFLGDVDEETGARAASVMRDSLGAAPKAVINDSAEGTSGLTLHGVGAFPRIQTPRVVWIGVESGSDALEAAHARLTDRLRAAGVPFDHKPFRAHLTLAYKRNARGARYRRDCAGGSKNGHAHAPDGAAAVDALRRAMGDSTWRIPFWNVVLYESRLTNRGAVHTPRASVTPGGTASDDGV